MAYSPCDWDRARFLGPSSRLYLAIMDGADRWETKPRLCQRHYDGLVKLFADVNGMLLHDGIYSDAPQPCVECVEDIGDEPVLAVFATGYRAGNGRADMYAPLHRRCQIAFQDRVLNVHKCA